MLSREALEIALPLTERLDRADAVVRPVSNTPLDHCVLASRSDTNFCPPGSGGFVPSLFDIEYIANAKNEHTDTCVHDVTMDNLIDMAAKAVQNHLTVVRTGVKPAIVALHDSTRKMMEQMPASSVLGMSVVIYDLPIPMKNTAMENLVSKFERTPLDNPALKMKCPAVDMQTIVELMDTGAAGFDNDVASWIAVKGDSFFLQLWEDVFQTKNDHFSKFRDAIECRKEGLDRALAIFLIARKLFEDPIEDIQMPLPAFKSLAAEFRNQAGAKISRALDDWALTKKTQILVKRVDACTVTVNECVYRPWIAAGGENEILFGSLIKGAGLVGVWQFDAAAVELKRAWNSHVALSGVAERSARFMQIKQVLLTEFRKSINELDEPEDGPDMCAQDREQILTMFKNELALMRESDCDDLYTMCLRLICRSRFYKTDAEEFLLNMEMIQKQNPLLSVREVATVATVKYIACWVADQFQVSQAVV